ncbi:cytochrome c [Flavobacterium sp.]|uniref:c-type cytochrome n=1 Tax=Flavobacterium sp. TaxID=239 RepID=UPI00121A881E|nr:cytochrome c [Flavobacterium sp.]RZJ69477.1 MAG: cytochrome c [Flavobacterium sp.]
MKSRILVFALAAVAFSCSPKVVVQPSTPAATETPKPEVAETTSPMPSPEGIAKGRDLYANNCGKCHKLFAPTDESKEDWEPILKRMQRKARLTDEDMVFIHDYIFSELK